MPRYPWPPYDLVCLYEHNCPYLDGLSTKWVLGEYRRADDVYHKHLRIIDNFREAVEKRENAELRARYQALHKRQFKPNRMKNSGCDMEETTATKRKKRGAPAGHPAWSRPVPTHIDRVIEVPAPEACPHCGSSDLTPENTLDDHLQEDIDVRPATVVTKYVHRQAYCPRCRRSVVGTGPDEIPNAYIGPQAKATAEFLHTLHTADTATAQAALYKNTS